MIPFLPRWIVAVATLLLLGIPASNAEEIVRKWTGSNGKIITGQLLWAQDDTVYLKDSRYGRRIKVALSNLSAADKLYVSDFLAKAKKEKLVYQFHLVRERYQKNELGTVPEQRNGTFLVKSDKKGGVLYWTFEPTAPISESLLSKKASLSISLDNGTKGQVSIQKNKQLISSRTKIGRGRHRFSIPVSSLLNSPTAGKTDQAIELRVSAPGWDGIIASGRTSPKPPTLKIYDR